MSPALPREVLDRIFQSIFRTSQLLSCAQTCRAWYEPAVRALYVLDCNGERFAIDHALQDNDSSPLVRRIMTFPFYFTQMDELCTAIIYGRKGLVHAMLHSATFIGHWRQSDGCDEHGRVALADAALNHDLETVSRLLELEEIYAVGWNYSYRNPLVAACCVSELPLTPHDPNALYDANDKKYKIIGKGFIYRHKPSRPIYHEIVTALLEAGHSANTLPGTAVHPLHLAVEADNIEIVKLLLNYGADVNFALYRGYTPLAVAVKRGLVAMVELLISNGAAWDFETNKGSNALHLAADVPIAKMALEAGVPIEGTRHAAPKPGRPPIEITPLMRACECNIADVAMFLLEKGARIDVVNKGGYSILQSAASRGIVDIVKIAHSRGLDVNAQEWSGQRSALHHASMSGDVVMAETLLSLGADLMLRDRFGETPLWYAHTEDMIRLLLAHGADIDDQIPDSNETKLQQLARERHSYGFQEQTLKLFIKYGADITTLDSRGKAPIHLAAASGTSTGLKVILEAGVEVDQLDADGWTPLLHASLAGSVEKVRVLLAAGANADFRTSDGHSAMRFARGYNRPLPIKSEIMKMLLEAGADIVHCRHLDDELVSSLKDTLFRLRVALSGHTIIKEDNGKLTVNCNEDT